MIFGDEDLDNSRAPSRGSAARSSRPASHSSNVDSEVSNLEIKKRLHVSTNHILTKLFSPVPIRSLFLAASQKA